MLSVPVLLITFNRPDHTRRVISEILKAQPKELFVFQDGPRERNELDYSRCSEVRQLVETLTKETDTVLHTNYSPCNLGCGAGPMMGIDWFFSQVEEGIVMEDDCFPHQDFFGYCQELLSRFKEDKAVRFINATLYDDRWQCEASYDFSHYMVTGAWAGWRRTWQGFDLNLHSLDAKAFRKQVLRLTENRGEANWWYSIVKEIQQDNNKKSYWDYQMQIHLFLDGSLTIHPRRNLVSNIGFDKEATHTFCNSDERGNKEVFPILPLKHPDNQIVDKGRDAYCWAKAQSEGWVKDTVGYLYESLLWSRGLGHKLLMAYKQIRRKGINTRKV